MSLEKCDLKTDYENHEERGVAWCIRVLKKDTNQHELEEVQNIVVLFTVRDGIKQDCKLQVLHWYS